MADRMSKWRDFIVEIATPRSLYTIKSTGRINASKLARAIGVSHWTIQRILLLKRHLGEESGSDYQPELETREKIAAFARCDVDDLDWRVMLAPPAPRELLPEDAP